MAVFRIYTVFVKRLVIGLTGGTKFVLEELKINNLAWVFSALLLYFFCSGRAL